MLSVAFVTLPYRTVLAEDVSLRCQIHEIIDFGNDKNAKDYVIRLSISGNYGYMIDQDSQFQTEYIVRATEEYFFFENVKRNFMPRSFRISRMTGKLFSQFDEANYRFTMNGLCNRYQIEKKF